MPLGIKKKSLTDDEKYQLQLQQENELISLQRQYATLEKSCKDKRKDLGEQQVLSIFKKEHENILTDLNVAQDSGKRKCDVKLLIRIALLLRQHGKQSKELTDEKQYITEIEDQIKLIKKDVIHLRSQQITDRQHEERVWHAMKILETLENKLEVQMKKFCTTEWNNQIMRDKINGLLAERKTFMKIWNQMLNRLTMGKTFMMDLIEQATIAYDQREDWCSKLNALRIKAHKELNAQIQEMRKLKTAQDKYQNLQEFISIKNQRRIMKDLEEKEKIKRNLRYQNMKEQVDHYRALIEEILKFTKEQKVKEFAQKYHNKEAQNFSLFNYINDLIREMETLNDRLGYFHLDIEEERALSQVKIERQKANIAILEEKLKRLNQTKDKLDEDLKESEATLPKMLTGIEELFRICQCNKDPLLELLGDNTKVDCYNYNFYLEMIEKKIQAANVEVYYIEKVLSENKKKLLSRKPQLVPLEQIAPTTPCPLCVENEMVSIVIDRLQHVLTKDQVKSKIQDFLKDASMKVHNVSACFLPKSRAIMQKRYQ